MVKNRTRNILLIIICVIATVLFALADISSYGKITNGFLGMTVLLMGSIIIPSVVERIKQKKK